jgi:hypothetical protein
VRSAIWFVVVKTIAGLNYIDASAASGIRFVGAQLRDLALYLAGAVWQVVALAGRSARSLALSVWALFVAGLASLGALLRAGAPRISAKVNALAPPVGNFLSLCFGGLAARAHDVSRSIGRGLAASFSWLSAKIDVLTRSAGEALAPALSAVSAKAYALAPSLSERIVKAGLVVGHYAKGRRRARKGTLGGRQGPSG